MEERIDHVYGWIWQMGTMQGVIPPFCVEVNLMDGTTYFLHSVPEQDNESKSLVMRVWDFRSFSQEDIEELKSRLNTLENRAQLQDLRAVHPKLDYADVRLHLQNINYAVEWNDRLLPREERTFMQGLLDGQKE